MATTLEGFDQVVVGRTACSAEVICFPLHDIFLDRISAVTSIYVVVVEHILLLLWLYHITAQSYTLYR